jgi:chromate reductase, NAD(P)H dehydrogenase (quinone)
MSEPIAREPLRVLVLSGSLRAGSFNTRMAALAARMIEDEGAGVDVAALREFPMPLFDADAEEIGGLPEGARSLKERVADADAVLIASPEYNASLPGVLKNAIDWLSRFRPQPFKDKQTMLVSASPSLVGGNRGLWALRVPLEHLGARVYPDMFSLAAAHESFTADGGLVDVALQQRLADTVASFLHLVEAATHYPSVRRRWYEFLSDGSDAPDIQRMQD